MRRVWESVRIAFQSLFANKLRSILTLIGMIIGVMTLIAIVSVINGMNNYVSGTINAMGSSTFIIDKYGVITSEEDYFKAQKRKDLVAADISAIAKNCEDCAMVGGATRKIIITVKRRNLSIGGTFLQGVTPNFLEVTDYDIDYGRSFTKSDAQKRRSMAIVGPDVVDNLFPGIDPIGRNIKINGYYFTIIGVAKPKGSTFGVNADNWVVIPLTTYEKYFSNQETIVIFAKASSYSRMEDAMDEARVVLRSRHHIKYSEPDDFDMMTSEGLIDMFQNFTRIAWIVLVGVSSISLIVGGIVIMNIMLVAVTDRTREIGIRKAVGAKRRDIMWQFLVESLTLSLVSGILGILCGAGVSLLVASATPIPSSVELWSVLAGVGISSAIGLFFGIYPAMKAARLDPIVALRYE